MNIYDNTYEEGKAKERERSPLPGSTPVPIQGPADHMEPSEWKPLGCVQSHAAAPRMAREPLSGDGLGKEESSWRNICSGSDLGRAR